MFYLKEDNYTYLHCFIRKMEKVSLGNYEIFWSSDVFEVNKRFYEIEELCYVNHISI